MNKYEEALNYFVAICTLNFDKEGAKNVAVLKEAVEKANKYDAITSAKDLKVLEIIKNKNVNTWTIKCSLEYGNEDKLAWYNRYKWEEEQLTPEEFNQIKEWLERK